MNTYLSKSDFKMARTCATKLYYRKNEYSATTEGSEYLELLAEGGYMIGHMAQLLFPGGIEVKTKDGTRYAIEETEKLLAKNKNITLFEPAISSKGKLVRIDVLEKKGNNFHLIEVKSKSYSPVNHSKKGNKYFGSKWTEYLEDVAFQKMTLQEKFPDAEITASLMVPDKDMAAEVDGMPHWFEISKLEKTKSGFQGYDVRFTGALKKLRDHHHLAIVPVDEFIDPMMPIIESASKELLASLPENEKIETQINCNCKGCEFRTTGENSGFNECWGTLAHVSPHILELGQLGNINRNNENVLNNLIKKGKVGFKDIPEEVLYNKSGDPAHNGRPLYQMTRNDEFLLPEFGTLLNGILKYPIHFIDFETSMMALPFYKGMRAYENVKFQWSCHTLESPGAPLKHKEWINTVDDFPNVKFAKSLSEVTGMTGSLMTWSHYENTQLRNIYDYMVENDIDDPDLIDWLKSAIKFDKDDTSRIIDMNDLAIKYYFHPMMGGRTSIKVTLPAVLSVVNSDRVNSWLKSEKLFEEKAEGGLRNPYELLPKIKIIKEAESVKDGSGAMRAYQDMMYGIHKNNPEIKKKYEDALIKYCKLDTLAMVIIWEHWMHLLSK